MDPDAFMKRLNGRMSDERAVLVDGVFDRLDANGAGYLALDQVRHAVFELSFDQGSLARVLSTIGQRLKSVHNTTLTCLLNVSSPPHLLAPPDTRYCTARCELLLVQNGKSNPCPPV